jgi:uncharacterized protein YbcI
MWTRLVLRLVVGLIALYKLTEAFVKICCRFLTNLAIITHFGIIASSETFLISQK